MKNFFLVKGNVLSARPTVYSRAGLLMAFIFMTAALSAQDIIFNVKTYKGGYNVSCNGSSNGLIDATIVGGVPPYTYSWSNGATTQDLTNIPAGAYTLTVTDALSHQNTKSTTLFEPDAIDVFLNPSVYAGGYNISKMGGNDGSIATDVKGGAPPYSYLWNTGSKKANIDKLVAGTYSVTITDQNGCIITKSITMLQPTPMVITSITAASYGGFNTRCYESKDGSINLTVSGGMPPYTYNWSNGSFDKDPANLPAGIYKVMVTDVNKATVNGQITLTQPGKLGVSLAASSYSNGYNISCYGCSNGTITSTITGGTLPVTYIWDGKGVTGQTSANIINLGPGGYGVIVTDANSCKTESKAFLSEPPSNSWDKTGNLITSNDFIGSTNNAPLIFKTVNTEKLRIAENGNVGIGTNNPQSKLEVAGDALMDGSIKAVGSITFGNDKEISYSAASGATPPSYGWGIPNSARGPVLALSYCLTPSTPPPSAINIIAGMAHFYGYNGAGQLNVLRTGFDGVNGIIDLAGNTDPRLLLNYYCGKDVDVCTGANGGNIHLTSTALGMVGIGIDNPTEKLDVGGNIKLNSNTILLKNDNNHGLVYANVFTTTGFYGNKIIDGPVLFGFNGGGLETVQGANKNIAMTWGSTGNVAIGIDLADNVKNYRLAVNGTIGAKEVVVEKSQTPWPDYVFHKSYKLASLNEVETYISENNHLPEVPSENEVEENGINVAETDAILLKKIEELTLYIIAQNKRIETLEKASKQ